MVSFKIKNKTQYQTSAIKDAIHTVLAGTKAYVDSDILLSDGDTDDELVIALGYDGSPVLETECELVYADTKHMRNLKLVSEARMMKHVTRRRIINAIINALKLAGTMSLGIGAGIVVRNLIKLMH